MSDVIESLFSKYGYKLNGTLCTVVALFLTEDSQHATTPNSDSNKIIHANSRYFRRRSSHNSASIQISTRKNKRKFDKIQIPFSYCSSSVPCLVTGDKPLEARSDIAFTCGDFKVAVDDTRRVCVSNSIAK